MGTRSEGVPDRTHPGPAVFCAEVVRAPDRLKLGEFKRECLARFRHDGSISHVVEDAKADGSAISLWDPTVGYIVPVECFNRIASEVRHVTP